MKPQYEHDCENCKFLGQFEHEGVHHDLYFCNHAPTVIARYGKYGHYACGLSFIDVDPILTEAAVKAIEKGLLNYNHMTGCGRTVSELLSIAGRGIIPSGV